MIAMRYSQRFLPNTIRSRIEQKNKNKKGSAKFGWNRTFITLLLQLARIKGVGNIKKCSAMVQAHRLTKSWMNNN